MSVHLCHAPGCTRAVPESKFACRGHWFMLSPNLRAAVAQVYVPGQEKRKDPTPAYMVVQTFARIRLALTEHRDDTAFALTRGDLARYLALLPAEQEARIPPALLTGARRIVAAAMEVPDAAQG